MQEENSKAKARAAANAITNEAMVRKASDVHKDVWDDSTASQRSKYVKNITSDLSTPLKDMNLRVSADQLRPTLDVVGEIADRLLNIDTSAKGLTAENLTDSLRASLTETKDINDQIQQMEEKFNMVGKSVDEISGKDFMSQFKGDQSQAVDFLKN